MDTINLAVNELMQFIFGLICHQDQSVLLRINNEFIPLCPRCIGLHAGFFLSLFIIILFNIKKIKLQNNYLLVLILFIISTTAIHWFLLKINFLAQDSTSRIITGFITGAGFAFLITLSNISKLLDTVIRKLLLTIILLISFLYFLFSFSHQNTFLKLAVFCLVLFNIAFIFIATLQLAFKLVKNNYLTTIIRRFKNETEQKSRSFG